MTYAPALIRDSRDLTALERLFLYTVHARGKNGLYTTFETACEDMSISVRTFRSVRKSLVAKGLLVVTERPSRTTLYRIDIQGLTAHCTATRTCAADAQVDDETYAADAHPTYAGDAQVPVQEVHTPPVQEMHTRPVQQVHTEGEPTKGNVKGHTNANTQGPRPRFSRGSDQGEVPTSTDTVPARGGEYRYNRMPGRCCLCGHMVQVGGGTYLKHQPTGKTKAAHHLDECIGHTLTEEERADHLAGIAPVTLRHLTVAPTIEESA